MRRETSRYLLGRGLLRVGVIICESPVEGGDVQAAVSTGKEAQPGLASGGVACGSIGKLQTLGNALHQYCPEGIGGYPSVTEGQRG